MTLPETEEVAKRHYSSPETAARWAFHPAQFPYSAALPFSEYRIARVYFSPGNPVLDVGCGAGRTVPVLVEAGFYVVGIDYSWEMANRAKANLRSLGSQFAIVVADAAHLPIRGRCLRNVMLAGGVIHSIPTRRKRRDCFEEVRRILHRDGVALVHYWRHALVPPLQRLVAPQWLCLALRVVFALTIWCVGGMTNVLRWCKHLFVKDGPEPGDAVFATGPSVAYRHNPTREELRNEIAKGGFAQVQYLRMTPDASMSGPRTSLFRWLNGETGYYLLRSWGAGREDTPPSV